MTLTSSVPLQTLLSKMSTAPDGAMERLFRALIRASAQLVWVTDPDGMIRDDSPSWRAFTGETFDEFRGQGWLNAVHPDDRSETLLAWRTAVAGRTSYRTEYRLRHRSGEWRWTLARGVPVFDPRGEIECWIGLNDDITERRVAQDALAESERLFRGVTQTVPDLVWLADQAAQIFFWNEAWYEYTGFTAERSLGVRAASAIHEDHRQATLAAWYEAVESREPFRTEFPLRRHDGVYRWFMARARPVLGEQGQVIHWTGALSDIDDQRRALEALRDERERRKRFVCALVHDLRNVLGATGTAIHNLLDETLDADERREFRGILDRSVVRAERMISDLLDANKLESGQGYQRKATRWLDPGALVREVVRATNNPKIEVRLPDAIEARWNAYDVTRILENVIGNAVKYGDRTRIISVELLERGKDVLVSVHNWGTPIPARDLPYVFDFLRRCEGAPVNGWGVGLSLVKGLCEAYGGDVSVASDEARGTTFVIRLPRVCRAQAAH